MKTRRKTEERSNEELREIIVKFFYDKHKNASSPKKMKLNITETKRELKEKFGLEGKEVVRNLDYLIQSGFILKEEEVTQIKTKKGTFPSKKIFYKAGHMTVNHFEGTSKFQKMEKSISGININNVQGVTTIVAGDSNMIINSQFIELYKTLDLLSNAIRKSDLSDSNKLDYMGEIDTIKSQISKPNPDKNIIKTAWEKLKPLATVSGIATFFSQVATLIGALI